MSQQSEDNQLATLIERKQKKFSHLCQNRECKSNILTDSEIVSSIHSRKQGESKLENQQKELIKFEISPSHSRSTSLYGIEDFFNGDPMEEQLDSESIFLQSFNHPLLKDQIIEFDQNKYTTQFNPSEYTQEEFKIAEQMEKEVMLSRCENIHIHDERNDPSVHLILDDDQLYSSVQSEIQFNQVKDSKFISSKQKGNLRVDHFEIYRELQDDFSTKANSTQDSMRPDSAKSEHSIQMGGGNLKSKGKKLRLTNMTFEPPPNHQTQNERFQTNKLVNISERFNLEEKFLQKVTKKENPSMKYAEEKLISQDHSWRSFLCEQKKKNHILLFNSLMIKSGHTSSGSSIGSRISNGFIQNTKMTKMDHNKLNEFYNQAALAMSLNLQQSLNESFTMTGPPPPSAAGASITSTNNLNNSFTSVTHSGFGQNNNNNCSNSNIIGNLNSNNITSSSVSNSTSTLASATNNQNQSTPSSSSLHFTNILPTSILSQPQQQQSSQQKFDQFSQQQPLQSSTSSNFQKIASQPTQQQSTSKKYFRKQK